MRAKGNIAEKQACDFLKINSFEIKHTNFSSRYGEIDIIAFKNGVLHFIEVKSGKSFEPIYNISKQKIEKICKTIDVYNEKFRVDLPYMVDAIIIKDQKIEHLENITI